MHSTFDFGPRPARKDSNVLQIKRSYELTVLIYTVQGAVREIPSHQKNVYLWFMAAKRNVPTPYYETPRFKSGVKQRHWADASESFPRLTSGHFVTSASDHHDDATTYRCSDNYGVGLRTMLHIPRNISLKKAKKIHHATVFLSYSHCPSDK